MDFLTNDAKYLLSSMYTMYIERRKSGMLKRDAVRFNDIDTIHVEIMPEWKIEDVLYTCFELKKYELITATLASNTMFHIHLTSEAIASLETTFTDKVDNVLEYAAKIKNAIPFI
ncbi:hypothetical protein AB1L05_21745 [Cytobacillus horneckiae]|uniref:hypothetical protein n=1 Tax=Cytobacillus horneckiae TaxID=549687 RepID=UPI0039A147B2